MVREAVIDEKVSNIETLVKRAQVMINDLYESYFCEEVKSEMDTWKILSHYYDNAGVKVCIIGDIVLNLSKSLEELRSTIDINADVADTLVHFPEEEQGDLK